MEWDQIWDKHAPWKGWGPAVDASHIKSAYAQRSSGFGSSLTKAIINNLHSAAWRISICGCEIWMRQPLLVQEDLSLLGHWLGRVSPCRQSSTYKLPQQSGHFLLLAIDRDLPDTKVVLIPQLLAGEDPSDCCFCYLLSANFYMASRTHKPF